MSSNKSAKSSSDATPHNDDPVMDPLEHAQAHESLEGTQAAAASEPVTEPVFNSLEGVDKFPLKSFTNGHMQQTAFQTVQLGSGGVDHLVAANGASQWDDDLGKSYRLELHGPSPETTATIKKVEAECERLFLEKIIPKLEALGDTPRKFKPILDPDGKLRVKVKTELSKTKTDIQKFVEIGGSLKPGFRADLNRGCEVLAKVYFSSIWITNTEYGVALYAKCIIVKPNVRSIVEEMQIDQDFMW